MDTKELLKMETALKDAREKVRNDLMIQVGNALAELRVIGFDLEVVEKNGTPKIGRPRKEAKNGLPVQ